MFTCLARQAFFPATAKRARGAGHVMWLHPSVTLIITVVLSRYIYIFILYHSTGTVQSPTTLSPPKSIRNSKFRHFQSIAIEAERKLHFPPHPWTRFHLKPSSFLIVTKLRPAKRTRARIARAEPLEQAAGVEDVLARHAPLRRQLLGRADDGVADCALRVALERAHHVLVPRCQAVDDAAVL